MQPDTTPLKLSRDIVDKLKRQNSDSQPSNEQRDNSGSQETETPSTEISIDASPAANLPDRQIQVVPLYTPEGSAIKFFCVHPSHRYALSLQPISTGFQEQVKTSS